MRFFCPWLCVALRRGLHPQEYREPMYRSTEKAKANSIRVHLLTLEGRSTDASSSHLRASGARSPVQQTLGTEHLELRLQWGPWKCGAMPCSLIPGTTAPWGYRDLAILVSRPSALSPVPGTEIINGLFSNQLLDGDCVFCICQRPF